MAELWGVLSSYPTIVYSVLLTVMLIFWLLAILGAVDLDFISFDADIDFDADIEIPGFIGLMHTLGFIGVPFTIVLSILIFLAWVFTFLFAVYVLPWVPGDILKYLLGTVVMIGSFVLAAPITSRLVAPLRRISEINQAKSNKDFVGYPCKVRSQTVDEKFGQGAVEDGGAGLIVNIRAATPNEMSKNMMVRIISYDKDNNSYEVVTEEEFKQYQ